MESSEPPRKRTGDIHNMLREVKATVDQMKASEDQTNTSVGEALTEIKLRLSNLEKGAQECSETLSKDQERTSSRASTSATRR